MLNLQVFEKAYRLSLDVHRISLELPQIEQFALADQIRRSSRAICSNLVEGFSRNQSTKEKRQYVRFAIGSNDEVRLWLQYMYDLDYLNEPTFGKLKSGYEEVGRMLHGLWLKLEK